MLLKDIDFGQEASCSHKIWKLLLWILTEHLKLSDSTNPRTDTVIKLCNQALKVSAREVGLYAYKDYQSDTIHYLVEKSSKSAVNYAEAAVKLALDASEQIPDDHLRGFGEILDCPVWKEKTATVVAFHAALSAFNASKAVFYESKKLQSQGFKVLHKRMYAKKSRESIELSVFHAYESVMYRMGRDGYGGVGIEDKFIELQKEKSGSL